MEKRGLVFDVFSLIIVHVMLKTVLKYELILIIVAVPELSKISLKLLFLVTNGKRDSRRLR